MPLSAAAFISSRAAVSDSFSIVRAVLCNCAAFCSAPPSTACAFCAAVRVISSAPVLSVAPTVPKASPGFRLPCKSATRAVMYFSSSALNGPPVISRTFADISRAKVTIALSVKLPGMVNFENMFVASLPDNRANSGVMAPPAKRATSVVTGPAPSPSAVLPAISLPIPLRPPEIVRARGPAVSAAVPA